MSGTCTPYLVNVVYPRSVRLEIFFFDGDVELPQAESFVRTNRKTLFPDSRTQVVSRLSEPVTYADASKLAWASAKFEGFPITPMWPVIMLEKAS